LESDDGSIRLSNRANNADFSFNSSASSQYILNMNLENSYVIEKELQKSNSQNYLNFEEG